MKFKGKCFGIELTKSEVEFEGKTIKKYTGQWLVEDDGMWHKTGQQFDGYWISNMLNVLQLAKSSIDGKKPELLPTPSFNQWLEEIKEGS